MKASPFTNHTGEKRNFHDRRGAKIKGKSPRRKPLLPDCSGLLMKEAA
jgi:hypothetical protein